MKGVTMGPKHRWVAVIPLVAALTAGCAEVGAEETESVEPAHVEPIEGSDVAMVVLKEFAAERIDLRTAPVQEIDGRLVVPSDALIVDPEGGFWVYTSPKHLEFVRHEIVIEHEEDGRAFLTEGPPPGTEIVTLGAQELWGAESGIGGH